MGQVQDTYRLVVGKQEGLCLIGVDLERSEGKEAGREVEEERNWEKKYTEGKKEDGP